MPLENILQNQSTTVSLSRTAIAVGQQIVAGITVRSLVSGEITLQEPQYHNLSLIRGPTITQLGEIVEVTLTLRGERAGRVILEPFVLSIGEVSWQSERALIEIYPRDDLQGNLYNLEWRIWNKKSYAGQTIVASLDVYNADNFFFPGNPEITSPIGAEFEEVTGLGVVDNEIVSGKTLFRFPLAVFLLTPSAAGTVTIPRAIIRDPDYTRIAPSEPIISLSLLENASNINAIGSFTVSAELDRSTIAVSDTAILTLRISGIGNLRFLTMPTISSDKAIISIYDEESSIIPDHLGYRGTRTQTIQITPIETGIIPILVEEFSWYDPSNETKMTSEQKQLTLEVAHAISESQPAITYLTAALQLLTTEEILATTNRQIYQKKTAWLIACIIPSVIIAIWFIFLRVFQKRTQGIRIALTVLLLGTIPITIIILSTTDTALPSETIDTALGAYNMGQSEYALEQFELISAEFPTNSAILYNIGIIRFHHVSPVQSIALLRQSLHHFPLFVKARSSLNLIEDALNIDVQISPPSAILFLIYSSYLLLAPVFIAIIILFYTKTKRALFTILFALTIIFSSASIAGNFIANRIYMTTVVIGQQDTPILRTPSYEAQIQIRISGGTAVRRLFEYQDFYLIETNYGLKGWVNKSAAILLNARDI